MLCVYHCVCVREQCGVTLALRGSRSCVWVWVWVGVVCGWVLVGVGVGGLVGVGWCVCIHKCLTSCCAPIQGSISPGLEGGEVFVTLTQSMETVDPLRI